MKARSQTPWPRQHDSIVFRLQLPGGPQNEIHTMGSYFPCPFQRGKNDLQGSTFCGSPCFHLPHSLLSSLPLARAAVTLSCMHLARNVQQWTNSPLAYSLFTKSKQSSTLDNDLDTSLEATRGIWFKRQALRTVPPAMSGGSRVAIETDGDYVTVLPHMLWNLESNLSGPLEVFLQQHRGNVLEGTCVHGLDSAQL